MGHNRTYRGPMKTVHHAMQADAVLGIFCARCRHEGRKRARDLYSERPGTLDMLLFRLVDGFFCKRCQVKVQAIIIPRGYEVRAEIHEDVKPLPPPLACWCGLHMYETTITAYTGFNRKTVLACPAHVPAMCDRCWDFATRQEGNEALCELCWDRKLKILGRI